MKEISNQMRPKLAFECIGGENTGIMFEFLCEEGILYHYGNLSLTPISNVFTKDMLFKNKTMKGFWLTNYLKSLNEEELEKSLSIYDRKITEGVHQPALLTIVESFTNIRPLLVLMEQDALIQQQSRYDFCRLFEFNLLLIYIT